MKRSLPTLCALLLAAIILFSCTSQNIPLVYDSENTGAEYVPGEFPSIDALVPQIALPDPLVFADGRPVKKFAQWERRRQEILAMLEQYEVGVKPQTPRGCVEASLRPYVAPEVEPEPMIGFDGKPFVSPYASFQPDTIVVKVTVGGESLQIECPVIYPEGDGPFPAVIGMGQPAGSLSPLVFATRGIAMIGFPFHQVMTHTQIRGNEPVNSLYPEYEVNGAYSMWPWGVSRLIDALEVLGADSKIDTRHLAVTGCSFAGKMALWSGAFDERIALTIAQEPGGGGAAAWRVSETLGEVETLGRTNYSWFMESMREFSECVDKLPFDHHELCALVAPRALLVLGNPDYPWLADEAGYVSCQAARKVWEQFGIADRMGFSFRDKHMHCMLPDEQLPQVEAFVERFLLGADVNTEVTEAPMFENIEWQKWLLPEND